MVDWENAIAIIATLIALWQLIFGDTQQIYLLTFIIIFAGYVIYSKVLERIDDLEEKQKAIEGQMKYHDLDKRVMLLENKKSRGRGK
jgi:nucleoside recognition membrane protein YjiH